MGDTMKSETFIVIDDPVTRPLTEEERAKLEDWYDKTIAKRSLTEGKKGFLVEGSSESLDTVGGSRKIQEK